MALSLVLRNYIKPQGVQKLFKCTPIVYNNTSKFTQLSSNNLKFIEKCMKNVKPTIMVSIPKRMMSEDHSFMWSLEKFVSAALLFIVPLGMAYPNFIMDNIMAVVVVAHSHWGVEAMVLDYIRPIIFGPVIPKLAHTTVTIVSILTVGGLMYFNYSNIGIGMATKRLWYGHNGQGDEDEC